MNYFKVCVYLWTIVAIVYLVLTLINKKKTVEKERSESRLIYLICLVIGMVLIFYNDLPYGHLSDSFYNLTKAIGLTGVISTVIGIGFSLWARFIIGQNWSGVVKIKENHQLIQSGPYSLVRHPTYTGFILALTGTVLAMDEWRGLIGLLILIISFAWKISKEEKMLGKLFPNYQEYQTRTKKLIPFIY